MTKTLLMQQQLSQGILFGVVGFLGGVLPFFLCLLLDRRDGPYLNLLAILTAVSTIAYVVFIGLATKNWRLRLITEDAERRWLAMRDQGGGDPLRARRTSRKPLL